MKYLKLIITILFITGFSINTQAQFLKKLAKKAEDKIEREAEKRAERRVNKKIDDAYDGVEDEIDGKSKKKKKKKKEKNEDDGNVIEQKNASEEEANENTQTTTEPKKPTVVWNKFDFVPGDTVLFEDAPSADEENGEFPSRWDLYDGNAEIGEVGGDFVIMFLQGGTIIPYIENSNEDYLPEIFTIEFDVYFKPGESFKRYWVYFNDLKNQRRLAEVSEELEIYVNGLEFGSSNKRYPCTEEYNWGNNPEGGWKHISIAFTKGKLKAYMDDTRLINVPHLQGNPVGFSIRGEKADEMMYMKNFRIAKGGVKYYDRVLSEGKIIVNGIKFDVNKATLKAESMGPINKIYKMMEKNTDLNFSVEGHTDADGGDEANMSLSKARGKAVMDKLVAMGIAKSRLKSTGFGESKPIDNNSTPEGKANNRRVEFVKF